MMGLSRLRPLSALKLSMTYRVYNAISYAGDTALMYATTYGNVEVVQALLAAKADVNAKDYIGARR